MRVTANFLRLNAARLHRLQVVGPWANLLWGAESLKNVGANDPFGFACACHE